MMRLAVVGAGGRLGKAVERAGAARGWKVTGFDRAALDLASPQVIESALNPLEFDALINCAALTNVDYSEQHPDEAHRINRDGPEALARICASKNARLLHVSTDYVFAGNEPGARSESDLAAPISHYGASKLAGEDAVLGVSAANWIVRVSWVFGPDRPSFIDFILNEALTKDRAAAIGDKWSLPGYAPDLAGHMLALVEKAPDGGIYHLCNPGPECSWQEYGQYALECAGRQGHALRTNRVEFQSLASMEKFIARRPIYTALATEKVSATLGGAPRQWHDAVNDYVADFFRRRIPG